METATITDISQLDLSKRYTYADYLQWQFDEMVELIRGRVFRMSPAPGLSHQEIVGNAFGQFWAFLQKKECKVFVAPFDVRIRLSESNNPESYIDTVVQPDICVVCDRDKLDERGCLGAPDLIVEILSKATAKKDATEKFDLYQQAGVKEYWLVHPSEGTVLAYLLNDQGKYELLRENAFTAGESLPVRVLHGLEIDLDRVFQQD